VQDDGSLVFVIGDVSGKGIAASLLMSNLQAMFRALAPRRLPLLDLMSRISHLFCNVTLPTHFATLICGYARPTGEMELCNAGHLPAMVFHGRGFGLLPSTGLPVGMFCDAIFHSQPIRLHPGDTLFLYTDGVTEALNSDGQEYGAERLADDGARWKSSAPDHLIRSCIASLHRHTAPARPADDIAIMAIRYAPGV